MGGRCAIVHKQWMQTLRESCRPERGTLHLQFPLFELVLTFCDCLVVFYIFSFVFHLSYLRLLVCARNNSLLSGGYLEFPDSDKQSELSAKNDIF